MTHLSNETKSFLKRDALNGAASDLVRGAAMMMAAAHIAPTQTLRMTASATREAMLEVIRLVKLIESEEAQND